MHREFTPLYELLSGHLGENIESLGISAVHNAIQKEMKRLSFGELIDYVRAAQHEPSILQKLIDEIVVPETWFFRDSKIFAYLASDASARSEKLSKHERIRVLSVPCATGEEPYSVAITLARAGISLSRCSIDAVDISAANIESAQRGVYTANSFRELHAGIPHGYVTQTGKHFHVTEEIRSSVRFIQGNIFSLKPVVDQIPYHYILCRNLLIYLTQKEQIRVLHSLKELLSDDGVLITTPAEAVSAAPAGLTPVECPFPYGFGKPPAKFTQATRPPAPRAIPPPQPHPVRVDDAPPVPNGGTSLASIHVLANQGALDDARALCDTLLQQNPYDPALHCLLGTIEDSLGQHARAALHYKRALYLEPAHHDALIHLAAIEDALGNAIAAERLLNRARRASQTGEDEQ